MELCSTSGGRPRNASSISPMSGTGHSTRPLTSAKSPASGTTSSPADWARLSAAVSMASARSFGFNTTLRLRRPASYSEKLPTAKRPGAMNRWPSVVSPAAIPSMSSATTRAASPSVRMHRIDCNGRTHRKLPAPQRMDLGHGKLRTTLSRTSATITSALRPGFVILAK